MFCLGIFLQIANPSFFDLVANPPSMINYFLIAESRKPRAHLAAGTSPSDPHQYPADKLPELRSKESYLRPPKTTDKKVTGGDPSMGSKLLNAQKKSMSFYALLQPPTLGYLAIQQSSIHIKAR